MKKINIKTTLKSWTSILAVLGLFLFSGCNNGGAESNTDYVNEIEAAENAVGDPILENVNDDAQEPQEVAPADVETDEDSVSTVDDDNPATDPQNSL